MAGQKEPDKKRLFREKWKKNIDVSKVYMHNGTVIIALKPFVDKAGKQAFDAVKRSIKEDARDAGVPVTVRPARYTVEEFVKWAKSYHGSSIESIEGDTRMNKVSITLKKGSDTVKEALKAKAWISKIALRFD